MSSRRAIILLSGGMDSATCLAIACAAGYECHALSVLYGQRSLSELAAAQRIAAQFDVIKHHTISVDFSSIGGSSLTDHTLTIPNQLPAEEIPNTYVPARNTVFLTLALGLAEVVDAEVIYLGANNVDYSNYPDCRPAFIEAFQQLAQVATKAGVEGHSIRIEAPLMHLNKAAIIQQGISLGVDYSMTISCYQADEVGRACGHCPSCLHRKKGFADAQIPDPTRYR